MVAWDFISHRVEFHNTAWYSLGGVRPSALLESSLVIVTHMDAADASESIIFHAAAGEDESEEEDMALTLFNVAHSDSTRSLPTRSGISVKAMMS